MAPVLCFTAEEIWQELADAAPRRVAGPRLERPRRAVSRGARRPGRPALLERWDRLRSSCATRSTRRWRSRAQEKLIGTALEAHVIIDADDPRSSSSCVPSATSCGSCSSPAQVVLRRRRRRGLPSPRAVPGLRVEVGRADGEKCERCWNYTTDVGSDADVARHLRTLQRPRARDPRRRRTRHELPSARSRRRWPYFVIAGVVLGLDQATKIMAHAQLRGASVGRGRPRLLQPGLLAQSRRTVRLLLRP